MKKNCFISLDESERRRTFASFMKVFRVTLNSFGSTFVEADSYVQDVSLRFYRGGHVTAEYLSSTVKRVEETSMAPQGQLFSTTFPFTESRA